MLTPANFKNALEAMGFQASNTTYEKKYPTFGVSLKVDLDKRKLFYPEEIKGRERNDFYDESHKENLVVFECVNRLLIKGYRPEHIELEKEWHLGHDAKGGRADICVTAPDGKMLFIIECKTIDKEYQSEYRKTKADGGQLFSYWQQERSTQWLVLYASDYADGKVIYQTDSIDCHDDQNILLTAKKDSSIKLYQDAHTTEELFAVWDETYEKRFCGDILFHDDTVAYKIGVKPLRKGDLKDFAEKDGVVNQFEEILRHNNVSDKENAFNRLVALFICKLVDEMQKGDQDEVDFQYKIGTDTYETLQDRLQRLHKEGMKEFMREDIFYVPDSYAEDLLQQYTGQKRTKMIDELKKTLRYLKFYTNNDFTFKDVHNEELFYQNGKILVEVVQLFEKYRIIDSNDLQVLGDLFEQLLSKGFKQNEGQFFTPIPITRFIWDSLPLDNIMSDGNDITYPKIIDYACGAGHFLTQGYEAVEDCRQRHDLPKDEYWAEKKLYGVEKDYRLARVSKISLFMHGAGKGNIIFGDGLDNYRDKDITPGTFDILVANPPYSVFAFKPHLKLKDNNFDILPKISNNGSEIETLFVERIAQLLKPKGIAAVILPSSILNKENGRSFVAARESLLTNFQIRGIALFSGKTFGATDTKTVILFLEKYNEPPKRIDLVSDSVSAILSSKNLVDWEDNDILANYIRKIGIDKDSYLRFINREVDYSAWKFSPYFSMYVSAFLNSSEYLAKIKQKGYLNSSSDEQLVWCNDNFYDFALKIESEKLTYFALCYRQATLVITAPADNKGQETFLGYTWSNRKRQEGIQIKKEGGLLYCPTNRSKEATLAALIRSSYDESYKDIAELEKYYHWLPLKDMLDFGKVEFNKAIQTSAISEKSIRTERLYPTEQLEKIVDINLETFDPHVNPEGKYCYVDIGSIKSNKIDYSNIITGENAPSRARRIANEGDILISTVRPNLKGFSIVRDLPNNAIFSTGFAVLSSKDSNIILNQFIYLLFMYDPILMEQMCSKMGKGSYPSINQNDIKNFYILIPPIKQQHQIIKEFQAVDEQINEQDGIIEKCDKDIKSRFIEMFGDPMTNPMGWEVKRLDTMCENLDSKRIPIKSGNRKSGGYPYYGASGIVDYVEDYIFDERLLLVSEDGANLLMRSTPIAFSVSGKIWVNNHAHVLRFEDEALQCFVENYFAMVDISNLITGSAQPKLNQQKLNEMMLPVPSQELLDSYLSFMQLTDKSKFDAQKIKDSLISRRKELINKHFK